MLYKYPSSITKPKSQTNLSLPIFLSKEEEEEQLKLFKTPSHSLLLLELYLRLSSLSVHIYSTTASSMAHITSLVSIISLYIVSTFLINSVTSTTFTMINKCEYTVWPGILSNANEPPLSTTGFALQKDETRTVSAPAAWGGRMWGRTHCSEDSTGKFTCITGDCGSGKIECSGTGAIPPATLAEFTLDGYGGQDFYDVSLVDGYNLPMLVVPQGGNGPNCTSTGCVVDLNGACPSELKVMSTEAASGVACKSACEAFQQPEYCCNGAYGTPDTCKPSRYSEIFKNACPRAYSYAYDDKSSTFTCSTSPDYTITFCPSPNTR